MAAPIPPTHRLWRSAKDHPDWHTWDADSLCWLPDGYALRFNPEWSVSWAEHLEGVHKLTSEAATGVGHPVVYEATVQGALGLGMSVVHTPQGNTPVICAHTSVHYTEDATPPPSRRKELRTGLARRLVRVQGSVTLPPPRGA